MKIITAVVLFLALAFGSMPTSAQTPQVPPVTHAPSAEQCYADARLWLSQLSKDDSAKLALAELDARGDEMWNCAASGAPSFDATMNYSFMFSFYRMLAGQRLLHYILRHNEERQLLDEDAEGQR
jgi:hypothetical protein